MADEEVKLFDNQGNEITASSRAPVCFFCQKNSSKYTCPRCNAGYCSVSCYNSEKHVQCSEGFYKKNVLEELSQRTKDPEDVQKVLSMLKNLEKENEEGEDEESEESSLEERLGGIDLDKADPSLIWESLTEDEKREFESSIKSGHLSQVVEEWIPWWEPANEQRKLKIQVLQSEERKNEETEKPNNDIRNNNQQPQKSKNYPTVLHNLQQLSSPASPLIKYSIIDTLYAYAYTMRLYNGSPMENPEQSSQTLYKLSSSLSKNFTFESLESAVYNSLNVVLESKDLFNSQKFSYDIILDIVDLIQGSFKRGKKVVNFVDCALSDAHRIIEKGRKELKHGSESCKDDVKRLWLAKKKLEFFLSWMLSNSDILSSFAADLRTLHLDLVSNIEIHKAEKKKIQAKWKGNKPPLTKKLIEEL
ncbi:zinc finger HIT domain-containing protein 2-like [Actinia tenebrosa]|uniref:Zinc finger HIT domain-containing protein 2-like n=1 Tax=Actinia tenebrosa TaxID=6105 RepID=A0A6P8I924_ACTTE|nr:zinc finger HIT domain-containing protein 2-like [Actinia tenebrosa]